MLIILYLLVSIYILFIKKNSKFTWLLVAGIIAFLSITTNFYADLDNYGPLFDYYNSGYVDINFSTTNFIWALLCKLFYMFGFNYRGMVIGLIFINYYIMHMAAKKLNCNENIFFGLFMIFPAIIQLVQLKFFTATALVIYAYSFLFEDNKLSIVKFLLLLGIAASIHSSNIIFLFLIFARKNKFNNKAFFSLVIILFTLIITLNLNSIINISQYFVSRQQYSRYFVNTITPSSNLWIILIFLSWLGCYLVSLFISKSQVFEEETNKFFSKHIISITLLLMTIPLLFIDRNMHRFLEVGYMILFIMSGFWLKDRKMNKNRIIIMVLLIFVLFFNAYVYTPYESTIKPIFSYDGFVNIRR